MTKRRIATVPRLYWSADEDALLRRRYADTPTQELAVELRRSCSATYGRARKLGLKKSEVYLTSPAACRLRRGDQVGAPFRFAAGHTPANKGLRRPGWSVGRGRMQETQFKKGVRQGVAIDLYQPIGTERVSKDGYLERKVNDDLPLQRRWRAVHRLMWENAHGPIPRGHVIAFINGDKRDLRIDNLTCISQADWMRRHTVHNLPAPLPQTIQLLGALRRRINHRSRCEKQD